VRAADSSPSNGETKLRRPRVVSDLSHIQITDVAAALVLETLLDQPLRIQLPNSQMPLPYLTIIDLPFPYEET
jgi:hypothetical protein